MQAKPRRDEPWLIRTYSGHSSAAASNALYHKNLAAGQTGLSVAFDLPTQTGFDPDHPLSRGEVGKVGVPVAHLGDMRALFDGIPLERMNTSMTINATAAWLLALYIAVAQEQGADPAALAGTVQNDILKEYLARGTYIFPPEPSLRLTRDVIVYTSAAMPKWNPINVCSYHLQEAGATPVQELAFALANAIAVLDAVRTSGQVSDRDFPLVVGRVSFFVNAGLRFITEMCKMRAFVELWDEVCAERYGVTEARYRRFRYGVQVNSLGLTEQQPENNVYRILLEMLAVVLSKKARARAVQLPAWNEALGLPTAWDQQWSIRLQQIVAYETDLLEYGDIFDGSREIEARVEEMKAQARAELAAIERLGGAVAALEHMKAALVAANAERVRAIEAGDRVVVGVNRWTDSEPSPLACAEATVLTVPETLEFEHVAALKAWRAGRDAAAVATALADLETAAREGSNIMPPSIACAKAGVTTGEWADALRRVFGTYRAPTGVAPAHPAPEPDEEAGPPPATATAMHLDSPADPDLQALRRAVADTARRLGRPLTLLIGKPGLDGHSNAAEQIALRARACGMMAIYDGIRLSPEEIVAAAVKEQAHVIGLSVLSGSHVPLVRAIMSGLRARGVTAPVLVGGIIPAQDVNILKQLGVARVYTPKDFRLNAILHEVVELARSGA